MADLTRSQIPPKGWIFFQPQTGWRAPTPVSSTFSQTVDLIIRHRLANKAITLKHKLSTDPNAVGDELEAFTRKRLNLPAAPNPKFPPRLPLSHVAEAAADIKTAAQGTAVVMDWLSSGAPAVAQELANKRAEVCVKCVKNVPGSWYTVGPAELIRATLSLREDKLETPHDNALQSCDVCKCLMRLKVWVPLDHIVKSSKPEILAAFPKWCWIAKRDQ